MSQECGCSVIIAEQLPGQRFLTVTIPRINYCPLHASAVELREAIRQIGQVARRKLVGREAGAEARQVMRAIADAALAASERKG